MCSTDVTRVLCELELTIRRVKVSTTPDGSVLDLFFITDARSVYLQTHPFSVPYENLFFIYLWSILSQDIKNLSIIYFTPLRNRMMVK